MSVSVSVEKHDHVCIVGVRMRALAVRRAVSPAPSPLQLQGSAPHSEVCWLGLNQIRLQYGSAVEAQVGCKHGRTEVGMF